MRSYTWAGFIRGFATGSFATLIVGGLMLYALNMSEVVALSVTRLPEIHSILFWAYHNLGTSLILFGLTLGLYIHGLRQLSRALRERRALEEISQTDQLTDVWTGLFFGIGVIWTAIGMRGALVYALGDPLEATREGAFAVLQRLVDGGILMALSTTIFGGIGGYLMRVIKTLTVGAELRRYYAQVGSSQGAQIHATLVSIERQLHALLGRSAVHEELLGDTSSMAGGDLRQR
jgi:hypothetical protein